MKTGIELITEERKRQIGKGWTEKHDDSHTDGSLAFNAAILAVEKLGVEVEDVTETGISWFELEVKKERTRVECLTIAGALIAAEIDRVLRTETPAVS